MAFLKRLSLIADYTMPPSPSKKSSKAPTPEPANTAAPAFTNSNSGSRSGTHIRLVPHVGYGAACYVFDVIDRVLYEKRILKLGRYNNVRHAHPERLSFKTKVVSRCHAELWLDEGKVYIRDTGSSSGTFVNRVRLSLSGARSSSPYEVKDGDLIQLGVDYQGGAEPHYRAVRMRLEVVQDMAPKERDNAAFEKSTFRNLQQMVHQEDSVDDECCICLNAMTASQALFLAPCSHMYHYKCMRPLLDKHFPAFACPLCRVYSNLDASVDEDVKVEILEGESMTSTSFPDTMMPAAYTKLNIEPLTPGQVR